MDVRRVLVAEDEALMAQMVVDMLSELPLEVTLARNGREALERAGEIRPDLILLDAMMPEMDGFEVAEALKANPATRDIPIIFMTARTQFEDKVRGLELGAEDYLVKPVRREELIARVRNVLRRVEAHRVAPPSLIQGRLDVMRLPHLIQVLEAERRTGTLHVTSEGRRGKIVFEGGLITYATEGPRQGEAALYRLLMWTTGEFTLESASQAGPPEARVSKPNEWLLMEGARRLDEISALRQALASLEGPVKIFPVFLEGLLRRTLPAGFRQLVALCDGTRMLPQLLESSSLDDWGTLSFLAGCLKLGMLEHGQEAKRASPRLGIQVPVDFVSLKAFKTGRSLDISTRGVFLRSSHVFPVGEEIVIQFKLPGVPLGFKITGRVIWSNPADTPQGLPAGMGIQFLDLVGEEQKTIEQYVVEQVLDQALTEETKGKD